MILYPGTLFCYFRFDTFFSFSSLLYINIKNDFKRIPANIVSWLGKTLSTESVCSTINVRSPKPWDTKHGVTQYWHDFSFKFLFKFDVCIIEKITAIIICIHKRFRRVHKILQWIGSSDFKQYRQYSSRVAAENINESDRIRVILPSTVAR